MKVHTHLKAGDTGALICQPATLLPSGTASAPAATVSPATATVTTGATT